MDSKLKNKELENVSGAGLEDMYCPYCNLVFPANMPGQMLQYKNHLKRHENANQ